MTTAVPTPPPLEAAAPLRRGAVPVGHSGVVERPRCERTPAVRLDSCLRRNDGREWGGGGGVSANTAEGLATGVASRGSYLCP